MCDNFVLNLRLQGLIHQKSLFQALYMTETEKEREDGVLGISFFFREREVGQDREDWLPHPKRNSKRRLVLSSLTLLTPKISLVFLFTISHTVLVMLVRRIWYWINL